MPRSNPDLPPWHLWVRNERQMRQATTRRQSPNKGRTEEWTIRWCAERAGMTEDTWRKMENVAVLQPRRTTAEKVAAAFEMDPDIVLQVAGLIPTDEASYPNLPPRSLAQYATLPIEGQRTIQALIAFYWGRYQNGIK